MAQQTAKVQLQVSWGKCIGGSWCELNTVNLDSEAFSAGGVYLIWHGGENPRVVYAGQAAEFRDRLAAHRDDPRIQLYRPKGLKVTWANVAKSSRDGVERYLADLWQPLVGERRPVATPIIVNSPWD